MPSVTDVKDAAQVQRMIDTASAQWGRLDILHNNAATTVPRVMMADTTVVDIDIAIWDEVIATDLRGYFLGCKFAIPVMIESGGGSIINTSSRAAGHGDLVRPAYGAAKAGVNNLTWAVATQYGSKNIRCNAITPGSALTPASLQNVPEAERRIIAAGIPLSRWGDLEDRAQMVVFLASDDASYVSGQVIGVDGGSGCHAESYGQLRPDSWW